MSLARACDGSRRLLQISWGDGARTSLEECFVSLRKLLDFKKKF